MLKNSKSIKFISIMCYLVAVLSLGVFAYELVKQKGNYMANLGLFVGLLVGGLMFLILAFVLNPPKLFNRNTLNFVSGLLLFAFAGVTIAFLIFDCIKAFDVKTTLICSVIAAFSLVFGVTILKIAKQDINVDARIAAEEKAEKKEQKKKAPLTKCPYCGCKLSNNDTSCPNCKSKLN